VAAIHNMMELVSTTLFVDYMHLRAFNEGLALAVAEEYYR